jgi:hypothetical protein
MGKRRGTCRVLVRNTEGRSPLGRPRRRWEDNIKMYFRDVGWGYILIDLDNIKMYFRDVGWGI